MTTPDGQPTGSIRFTLIGGPTALLDYAGTRILLDPTFSPGRDVAPRDRPAHVYQGRRARAAHRQS